MRNLLIITMTTVLALTSFAVSAGNLVNYKIAGENFEGYQVNATGSSKGLVLLIHDWDGLTEYEEKRSEMIAALGYDVFAVDLYGQGNRPVKTKAKKAETGKLYEDRERMRNLILGGLATASQSGTQKTIVMGYCFGGAATLELARSGEAQEVVGYASFHGGLKTPQGQNYKEVTSPILIAHGGADTAIPMTDVANIAVEMEASKTPYEIQVYSGAPHAFTVFGSERYHPIADRQSWQAFKDFLESHLGG